MTFRGEEFEEYVKARCWSCWEGCACDLPKEHEGIHKCGCDTCDCTWTTEQEMEWLAEMRRWPEATDLGPRPDDPYTFYDDPANLVVDDDVPARKYKKWADLKKESGL